MLFKSIPAKPNLRRKKQNKPNVMLETNRLRMRTEKYNNEMLVTFKSTFIKSHQQEIPKTAGK